MKKVNLGQKYGFFVRSSLEVDLDPETNGFMWIWILKQIHCYGSGSEIRKLKMKLSQIQNICHKVKFPSNLSEAIIAYNFFLFTGLSFSVKFCTVHLQNLLGILSSSPRLFENSIKYHQHPTYYTLFFKINLIPSQNAVYKEVRKFCGPFSYCKSYNFYSKKGV